MQPIPTAATPRAWFIVAACAICATPLSAATLVAVTSTQQLVRFDSATPSTFIATVPITGMTLGETVIGLDLRPSTGDLVAAGSTSRLYRIHPTTGVATVFGSAGAFTLTGSSFGFDFNPVPDRIRVSSDLDQNLRLNPITGGLAANDGPIAYAAGDINVGQNPNLVGSAYTNSFHGTTGTTLYALDSQLDLLVTQSPPNDGKLNSVGPLGVDISAIAGFDVLTQFGPTNQAFAALSVDGTSSALYSIDLVSGAATSLGAIGPLPTLVSALAVVPPGTFEFDPATLRASESSASALLTVNRLGGSSGTVTVDFSTSNGSATAPADYADSDQTLTFAPGVTTMTVMVPLSADDERWRANRTINVLLSNPTGGALLGSPLRTSTLLTLRDDDAPDAFAVTDANRLVRFNLGSPEVLSSNVAITGTVAGEAIVGLDSRPLTRELFGLGAGSRLYRIDRVSGAATQIGSDGGFALSGTMFGFDFNPSVDRLRVVGQDRQNLRLAPDTGALAFADGVLTFAAGDINVGQAPFVIASGYVSSVAGTTSTTLYGIDAARDALVIQSPPNDGTLATVGSLGFNSVADIGFDIAATDTSSRDFAYATMGADLLSTSLYSIDLGTGAATVVGAIGPTATLVRALAIDDPHLFRGGFEGP